MLFRSCVAAVLVMAGFVSNVAAQDTGFLALDVTDLTTRLKDAASKMKLDKRPIPMAGNETAGQHDCFWMGPVYSGAFNIAYPDGGAVYWGTVFKMPQNDPDARLELAGTFPKARYMSLHSYNGVVTEAAPYDRIIDVDVAADAGAQNPYLTGTYEGDRSYTITVAQGPVPEQRAPNTVYLGPQDSVDRTPLLLRHYIPETGDDLTGDGRLPIVTLIRGDGSKVTGKEACAALNSPAPDDPERKVVSPMLTQEQFDEMLENPAVTKNYLHTKHMDWSVFWDPKINLMGFVSPKLQEVMKTAARVGLMPKTSGFYANLDNQYVALSLNDKFGDVVVLEATLPRTPNLGKDAADAQAVDLRYWSLCSNESLVTTRFSACVYDSQITLTEDRKYTIVVSKSANRPKNAKPECGVTWLDWGDAGDGAGNTGITALLLRNMAPSDAFAHAVQRIPGPGLEAKTMGVYLPEPQYQDVATFEARGC